DGLVQFNFKLSGDMRYGVSDPPLHFNRPALHVWRQPQGIDMHEWTAPHARERQIAISVRPEFLVEQFLTSDIDIPPQLQAFVSVSNPDRTIGYYQLPLTAEMFAATGRLMSNPFQGKRALLYTEGITLELLCAAVESFYSPPSLAADEYNEHTLRRLQKARRLL